jgi:DNA-binding response OmpR family regulator
MKILIVGGDNALLSLLAEELESRGFEVLPTHFGDGRLEIYKKRGPWEFVLADCRFIPGVKIKDCMQLVTAIRLINSFQQMAIMTAESNEVRRNLPEALQYLPVLRKPFRVEQVLRLLRQPVLPL